MSITDGNSFGKMGIFRFWCQKVLPAVYDDSLSYYELLCKVVHHLNQLIEISNTQSDAISELQELLAQFMEGEFDSYIEEKVDEWFEENQPQLENDVEDLFERVSKLELENTKGSCLSCITLGEIEFSNFNDMYGHAGAIADIGNDTQIIIGTSATINTENKGYFRKVSIQDNIDDWSNARQDVIVGHANSLAFNKKNGKIYVAPIYDYNTGVEVLTNKLYVLDANGNLIDTVITPTTIVAITYNYSDEKMYCLDHSYRMYEYDYVENEFNLMGTIDELAASNQLLQDISARDNILYIMSYQGILIQVDLITLKPYKYNGISAIDLQDNYYLGEFDGIEFNENGNLIGVTDVGDAEGNHAFIVEIMLGNAPSLIRYCMSGTAGAGRFNRGNQFIYYVNQNTTVLRAHGRVEDVPAKSMGMLFSIQNLSSPLIRLKDDYYAYNFFFGYKDNISLDLNGHEFTVENIIGIENIMFKAFSGTLHWNFPIRTIGLTINDIAFHNIEFDPYSNNYMFTAWNAGMKFVYNVGCTWNTEMHLYENGTVLNDENSIFIGPLLTKIN